MILLVQKHDTQRFCASRSKVSTSEREVICECHEVIRHPARGGMLALFCLGDEAGSFRLVNLSSFGRRSSTLDLRISKTWSVSASTPVGTVVAASSR